MPADFAAVFAELKRVFAAHSKRLPVKVDTPIEYAVVTKTASPFPQHKGHPLDFGSVRLGKAYVSFHLMPLYMCPAMKKSISQALRKRMQGKTCFNFKSVPDKELVNDLQVLTAAAIKQWEGQGWM